MGGVKAALSVNTAQELAPALRRHQPVPVAELLGTKPVCLLVTAGPFAGAEPLLGAADLPLHVRPGIPGAVLDAQSCPFFCAVSYASLHSRQSSCMSENFCGVFACQLGQRFNDVSKPRFLSALP